MSSQSSFVCEAVSYRKTTSNLQGSRCLCCSIANRSKYSLRKEVSQFKSMKARNAKPKAKDHR